MVISLAIIGASLVIFGVHRLYKIHKDLNHW